MQLSNHTADDGERDRDGREPLGRHLLVDFWGCRQTDEASQWEETLTDAVAAMGATLLRLNLQPFCPHGLTAVAILAESHLAVHTWPEHDYVAIDIYTCGVEVHAEAGIDVLRRFLNPTRERIASVARGVELPPECERAATEPSSHELDDSKITGTASRP
jgi:S-adenosylmethionine decarboxylase proenzyme